MDERSRGPTSEDDVAQILLFALELHCKEAGARLPVASVGDCCDKALYERSFPATGGSALERELLDRERFRTQAEALIAVFDTSPRPRPIRLGCIPLLAPDQG